MNSEQVWVQSVIQYTIGTAGVVGWAFPDEIVTGGFSRVYASPAALTTSGGAAFNVELYAY
jgi:hypothetical protein